MGVKQLKLSAKLLVKKKKKEGKEWGECSRDGVASDLLGAGASEGKRGLCIPGDFDQDSKPPTWSPS